jgi:hypothetical protein
MLQPDDAWRGAEWHEGRVRQGLREYAIILALLAATALLGFALFGSDVRTLFRGMAE